jgi:multimeric flavodoxin WrbA
MKNEKLKSILQKHIFEAVQNSLGFANLEKTIKELEKFPKILLLPCSNRFAFEKDGIKQVDTPKSTLLAQVINEYFGEERSILINVPDLNIDPCEGNVSRKEGNSCGLKDSALQDPYKNPTGNHRCWANINNPDDELWKISKELFESDAVLFFSSVRWGQTNMHYQNLIERLTWLENRHATLKENNIIKDINSGFICVGQNWNGKNVVETQKKVHQFFGFKPNNRLYWNWQYTDDVKDETKISYQKSHKTFIKDFKIKKNFEV